ncbi:MPN domain-containing protein [Chelonia mydas]|uniref:MPN domain-containing protein n=1 Tax=Chelonia mydas TaxID=8469 RepID=M7ANC5_CHEMY|nr:MPN domain-containing protein [Chelonia mydas]
MRNLAELKTALDADSPGAEECLEEDEEELETSLEDPENESARKPAPGGHSCILTRRGITLRVLLKDGLIEPGAGVLSIYYLGKKFLGDLLPDGKITWQETGQVFNSPSAWATYCKKLVNPAKKSGCGWASSLVSEGEEEELAEEEEDEAREGKIAISEPALGKKLEEKSRKHQSKSLVEQHNADNGPYGKRPESKNRTPVRYCTLGSRDSARNPHTLVEVTSFAAINKFQPFNVAISSNVLLLLICQNLFLRGLALVGWDPSHPFSHALPSLQDIDAQMDYQLKLQGSNNSFQPCLALICAPYYPGNQGMESKISPFWVMPPPEQRPNDYGIPMEVELTYVQDGFLTNDVLHEMMLLVEFYKGAPDLVKFQDIWSQEQTYLDKLKGSLASRTPKDQGFAHVLEQIYSLLKHSS